MMKTKKLQCALCSNIQQKQILSRIIRNPFTIVFGICVCLSVSGDLALAHANMSTKTSTVKFEKAPNYKSLFERQALASLYNRASFKLSSDVNLSPHTSLIRVSPFTVPNIWGNNDGAGKVIVDTDMSEIGFYFGGGRIETGSVETIMDGSTLEIKDCTLTSKNYAAGFYGGQITGEASYKSLNNSVTISNAKIISTEAYNNFVGGYINGRENSHVSSANSVTIDTSTIEAFNHNEIVAGILHSNGNNTLTNNTVKISNSKFNISSPNSFNQIYAASVQGTGNNTFIANKVSIENSTFEGKSNSFYSASYSNYSDGIGNNIFRDNSLEFTGDVILKSKNSLYGVYVKKGEDQVLENNSIRLRDATINGDINYYTAFLSSYVDASGSKQSIKGNTLSIDNSTVQNIKSLYAYNGIIIGGASTGTTATITENVSSFKDSTIIAAKVANFVNGYIAVEGEKTLSENEFVVDNTVIKAIGGLFIYNGIINGKGNSAITNINTRIDNGSELEAKEITLSTLIQGTGNQTISQSNLLIDNASLLATIHYSSVAINLYGGEISSDGDSSISDTSITIDNASRLKAVYNSDINIFGGLMDKSGTHSITGTSIIINNGARLEAVAGNININGGTVKNINSDAMTISDNSIFVGNGSVLTTADGDIAIFGGVADNIAVLPKSTVPKSIINNTVIFKNNPVLSAVNGTITIAGSNADNTSPASSIFSDSSLSGYLGNRLILDNARLDLKAVSANSIVENFEYYEFIIPNNIQSGETLLTAKTINLSDKNGNHASLSFTMEGGGALPAGTKITLLGADTITGDFVNVPGKFKQETIRQGIGLQYGVTTELNNVSRASNHELNITVGEVKRQEQSRVPAEAQIATLAFLNQGGDLVSDLGIQNLRRATQETLTDEKKTNWATFVATEGGDSKYAKENDSSANVKGFSLLAGLAKHRSMYTNNLIYGAFFEYGNAEIKTHNTFETEADINTISDSEYYGGGLIARLENPMGFYGEASLRLGGSELNHTSDEYHTNTGTSISHDKTTLYYGAHATVGYGFDFLKIASLDIYAKYLWTHQNDDVVNILNDSFKFESMNSNRLRAGFRYSIATEYIVPFIGAAWEQEFSGTAESSLYGVALHAPSLKGGTAIIDVGLRASIKSYLTIEAGIEGYLGIREGISGKGEVVFSF